ncbi:hypothetical protein SDC9_119062 [bioreactor metagenome]|uniref:Uncharacterized protein n=1 Tax=bioreactor metagenome TaxID=1076179 RepID=A0A645C390_9ZZZZ
MLLLEAFDERKPRDGVAQCPDRKLDQHLLAGEVEIVFEKRFLEIVLPVDFKSEPDEEFLDALDRASGLHVHGIQKAVGVQVSENTAVISRFREADAQSVVEVEADAVRRLHDRLRRRERESRLLRRFGLNRKRSVRHRLAFDTEIRHIRYILLFQRLCLPRRNW